MSSMGIGTIVMTGLAFAGVAAASGALLGVLARRCPRDDQSLSAEINKLLPQTQCAQCGYPGCAPYAEAIAEGEAAINRCPPGGEETVAALAELLGDRVLPLADDVPATQPPLVAVIDEDACIGCALCLPACPVDAILGAHRRMHTVISVECTGCELCIEPCPVDCISLKSPLVLPEW